LEPVVKGLHITHWSSRDLACQAKVEGILPTVSEATVRRILHQVDLQPHRTRYWKTSHLDRQFKQRAEQILGCYANANRLVNKGFLTICVDEIANVQVLERSPIKRAIPGVVEHQEFEYIRHGTVNILVFLVVPTGLMQVAILDAKEADHYIKELKRLRHRYPGIQGVYLIHDNDPSHTAQATHCYFSETPWWHPCYTPVHASWLNQAEILIHRFRHYYLKRGSWKSCEEFIEHVMVSCREYNWRYAEPIEWTWTNEKMRQWFKEHTQ
jgi:hypothetical protein